MSRRSDAPNASSRREHSSGKRSNATDSAASAIVVLPGALTWPHVRNDALVTMQRLVFHVARGEDGWVFGLPLATERALRARNPNAQPAERIFIARPSMSAYQRAHAELWGQVAALLTGLSEQQLEEIGGWQFVDPVAGGGVVRRPHAARRMTEALYNGRAGQLAVMAELLLRGWNVAIPEVDVGDDVARAATSSRSHGRSWRTSRPTRWSTCSSPAPRRRGRSSSSPAANYKISLPRKTTEPSTPEPARSTFAFASTSQSFAPRGRDV
jgi:hypothetical protein